MDGVLQKILSGIEQLQTGQKKLEQKMNDIRTELLEKIDDVRSELLEKIDDVRSELLEEIDGVRSELLEEIAILEGKVENNEKQAALRHEEYIREMRLVKIDIDFLKEKTAKHESEIYQMKMLNQ